MSKLPMMRELTENEKNDIWSAIKRMKDDVSTNDYYSYALAYCNGRLWNEPVAFSRVYEFVRECIAQIQNERENEKLDRLMDDLNKNLSELKAIVGGYKCRSSSD